jgi:hypothetical protein
VPQLAQSISRSLDSASGNWLRGLIGNQATNNLSRVLANTYTRSVFGQVEAMGTHSGSFMGRAADRVAATSRLTQAVQRLSQTPGLRDVAKIINGYKDMLNAVHNSTQFAFIQANRGRMPLTRLAMESRDLTGNPQTAGRYYTPAGRPITFDTRNASTGQRIAAPFARAYNAVNEAGRVAVPWYNMTQQGIKRFGTAAFNNPIEFGLRTFLYYMLPPALGYYLTKYIDSLGHDPNGTSYLDHMLYRRDEYRQSMNLYIPIPGRPAEDGIEFPWFQEGVLPKRLIEAGSHYGRRL